MIKRQIDIINKLGLHARAAAKFVTLAAQYQSDIQLVGNDRKVNGKSIMGVMMLAAGQGASLDLIARGKDENAAVDALEALVKSRFGEKE